MKVEYKVDDGRVKAAFRRAPHIMYRELNKGLDSAATRMVRAAQRRLRKNDSLAFSTLVDAIRYKRTGDLERTVWPDTDYARYLEEGTKPGYFPNGYALTAWLKARGAENPKRQSFALAKHILKHGTKARPFFQPAFEQVEPTMRKIVENAARRGAWKAFE